MDDRHSGKGRFACRNSLQFDVHATEIGSEAHGRVPDKCRAVFPHVQRPIERQGIDPHTLAIALQLNPDRWRVGKFQPHAKRSQPVPLSVERVEFGQDRVQLHGAYPVPPDSRKGCQVRSPTGTVTDPRL